ncbi:MAG: RDD family protein [Kastovskya adunca ATA6-11-RM4]|jgi:uncharacterized RDD family membrane protein YckC|nr:RDD family protein [Kastovskya adunca ATA6-11-RM4]
MSIEPVHRKFPKVPIERRAAAFAIDFVVVWLVSSIFRGNAPGISLLQMLVFILLWLALRVILVLKNQGQSLGHLALDMKVLDAKYSRIPGVLMLMKREGILGFCSLLAMIGLTIGLANGISLLILTAPLAADCGMALADQEARQAFHDRVANTIMIQTRRGFSLDLRIKKVFAQIKRRMRQ